jgi:methyl-accepting chemotaxis protein
MFAKLLGLSIRFKLAVLVGLTLFVLAALGVVAERLMGAIHGGTERIYDHRVVPMKTLKLIADDYAVLVIDAVNKVNAGLLSPREALRDLRAASRRIDANWEAFKDHDLGPEEQRLMREAERLFARADQRIADLEGTLSTLGEDGKGALAAFDGPLYAVIDPISAKLAELVDLELEVADYQRRQAETLHAQGSFWFMLAALGTAVLLAGVGYLIYYSVQRPVADLRDAIEHVAAESDLTCRVPVTGKDELGATGGAFNGMLTKLKALVGEIAGASAQLASAGEELSTVSAQTNQGIARQQAETQQVATAMNEMATTVQEVARNAAEAASAAQHADKQAAGGDAVVGEVVGAIRDLAGEVSRTAEAIGALNQESDNIGQVLTVIREIAEQTNLLALNAAIEAARAGDQGRGFAVVADEVRTLASRTHGATQEIQAMIERLQGGAKGAVAAMERGRATAEATVDRAEHAGQALKEIIEAVATINTMNAQIADAAEQQGLVAEEINRNVVAIHDIAGETAQGAEQSARASEELAKLAGDLQHLVGRFRT